MEDELDLSGVSEAQKRQLERMRADRFICDLIGVKLTEVGEAYAKAELAVTSAHLNGVGICQGGVLFSIADYALAAAFNYLDESVVSMDVSISYCKSAVAGDQLVAEAREIVRTRSTTVGEAVVKNEKGEVLCLARGRGYVLKSR